MTKAALEGKFEYFRLVLGMSRKLIAQFPEDKLNFKPVPEVRTVAEIVGHCYASLFDSAAGIAAGQVNNSTPPAFANKTDMLTWMDKQVAVFYADFAKLTDQQITGTVSAWGQEFTGWQILGFIYDEHWHHRGQLTVYLRLLGIEPIMVYDYESLQA